MTRSDVPAHARTVWSRAERLRARIAYWVLVVACLVIAGGGWYLVRLEEQPARVADPVQATVEHVDVITRDDGHGHMTKRPLVIYSYSIHGVRYTTDRLTSLGRTHDSAWVGQVVQHYRPGQAVTAYVSPSDPGSAFLLRDYDWRAYVFLGAPLVLGIGLIGYWPWTGLRDAKQP